MTHDLFGLVVVSVSLSVHVERISVAGMHPTKIGVLLLLRQHKRISESFKEYPYVLRVCLQR